MNVKVVLPALPRLFGNVTPSSVDDSHLIIVVPAIRLDNVNVPLLCPEQTCIEEDTSPVGSGFTVTSTLADEEHPFKVPVTVYVVVNSGLAVTVGPVVTFKPKAGLQIYVVAPLAVSTTLPPEQKGAGAAGLTVTVGDGFIVTLTVPGVLAQPFTDAVTE